MDGFAHFLEGAATTDIGHRCVDVGIGGFGLGLEQRCGRHQHARLAIAALGHFMIEPGLLHFVQDLARSQALDGGDFSALNRPGWNRTRTQGCAIKMDRASIALGNAAAVFGTSQSNLLADSPEQRCVGVNVDSLGLAIDGQTDHAITSLFVGWF